MVKESGVIILEIFLLWLVGSILVAILATKKNRSAFGWFLFSALLSPILGGIALLILGDKNSSLASQLKDLDRLLKSKFITQEEYDLKRKQILGG